MLIDTHAHVNFSAFKEDFQEVLDRANSAGVLVVNVGTHYGTSKSAVDFAEKHNCYAVVGLHPVHTYSQEVDEEESHFKTREEKFDYEAYKKLAEHERVVGIGECGLDYFRLQINDLNLKIEEVKKLQRDAFVAQIRLAQELKKALVIHCRPSSGSQDAYEDVLETLDEVKSTEDEHVRFVIHSFTGTPEIAQEFVRRGGFVGLNGIITFDKTGNMEQVVKALPLEHIVLETDCPYLTPLPFRGKKNEPAYVTYVAEKVAEIKGLSKEEAVKATTQNATKLFQLPAFGGKR